jgi:hypothetical protein
MEENFHYRNCTQEKFQPEHWDRAPTVSRVDFYEAIAPMASTLLALDLDQIGGEVFDG